MAWTASIGISLLVWVVVNLAHAVGHLLAARSFGVAVNRVSLGLGPTLWSRRASETTYRIALLPIAVIVRLHPPWEKGASGDWSTLAATDLRSRSRVVRLVVFAAAPSAVLLVGVVAAFWMNGFDRVVPSEKAVVGEVRHGGPADNAGIRVGDTIVAINGKPVESWAELRQIAGSLDSDVAQIRLQRGSEIIGLEVRPGTLPGTQTRIIGIGPELQVHPAPRLHARIGAAVGTIREWLRLYVRGVASVLTGSIEPPVMGGPVALYASAIPDLRSSESDDNGRRLAMVVTFAVLEYFVLCLLLPYLDGRRLLFLGIEAVIRKPIHPKYEQWFNRIWLGFFLVLGLLVIKNDFMSAVMR